MKFRVIIFILLSFSLTAMAQSGKYLIKGWLRDSKVPVKVYLSYRDGENKVTDSTEVKGQRFSFSGTLEHATEATLYVHWLYPQGSRLKGRESEGTQFMLEPGILSIEGERLFSAKISGGQIQREYLELKKSLDVSRDSVFRIWKNQQGELPEDSALAFNRLLYAQRHIGRKITRNFILTHPSSEMSFQILRSNTVLIDDMDFVQWMVDVLRPSFGHDQSFKSVEKKVNLARRLSIGQLAIPFRQTDHQGKIVSLEDVKGKFVLIDFWASWCGPCRSEYPFLKAAYAKYKDRNFEIVGVSLDDSRTAWLNAISSNRFQWIQLSDLKGRKNDIAMDYGVYAIPQNFLLDTQGRIVAKNLRGDDLMKKLDELIP